MECPLSILYTRGIPFPMVAIEYHNDVISIQNRVNWEVREMEKQQNFNIFLKTNYPFIYLNTIERSAVSITTALGSAENVTCIIYVPPTHTASVL